MERDLVKRFIKKDGSQRISFYRDEYAENPRYNTDEPLHCEDWDRNCSIMNKHERETKSENACKLIRYMLERYGNTKEIFKVLFGNAKSDKHSGGDNALVYDKSRREWILNYWNERWTDSYGEIHGNCWIEEASFCCKIKDLTAWDIASYLSDEQVEVFANKKYFTDGIKMMSYSFGYYGDISFSHDVDASSEGVAWLEKDEFLEYSGCSEDYWKGKNLDEIESLIGELEAYGNNDVYGLVVEDCIKSKVHKTYTNFEKEDNVYEEEKWEEADSCWGFYAELDKAEEWMFEQAGLDINEFEEE